MERRELVLGVSVGLAVGALAVMLRRRTDRIEIRKILPATPEEVAGLIAQVEREPEFIPGVHKVQVLERGPDWVRYRVDLAGGAWVRYCKTWEEDRIAWSSEAGTLGLEQTGLMRLSPVEGGTAVHMTVETSFETPGIGPLAAAGSHPYAAYAFRIWLENLGRALA